MNTLGEVIAAYVDWLRLRVANRDLGEQSLSHWKAHLTEFSRLFGHKRLDEARRHDLTAFVTAHPSWKSGYSQASAIAVVIRCFRWAEDEELIAHAPYRRPRHMRFNLQPRQPMKVEAYVKIMRAAAHRPYQGPRAGQPWYDHRRLPKRGSARALRRALFFLRRTGARTCEMREMTWADVDFEAGVVRLVEHKTVKATASVRMIGLDPCTLRFLRNLHRQRENPPAGEHVFLNGRGRGKPWNRGSFGRLLRIYADAAGVTRGQTGYGLRHLFCVTGIENGIGERQIADQLGHTSTRFVAWYGLQSRANGTHLRNVVADVLRRDRKGGGN